MTSDGPDTDGANARVGVAATLWPTASSSPRRGRPPRLSARAIVKVGTAVADAEGLDAVSMHRLGVELGFTKMALYRHFPAKSDLLAAMLDAAFGPPPDVRGDWRAGLRVWALSMADVFAQHPWVGELSVGNRVYGPNEMGWTEAGLLALADSGLVGGNALNALSLLGGHVKDLMQQSRPDEKGLADIGVTMASVLAVRQATYPRSHLVFHEAAFGKSGDSALEFGIEIILDGLACLVHQRVTPPH